MEKLLRLLFDYQRFMPHPRLTRLTIETERRVRLRGLSLPDQDLSGVSAGLQLTGKPFEPDQFPPNGEGS